MVYYLHGIQICPIKSMALDAGETIIVELATSKEKKKKCMFGCFSTGIPNIVRIISLGNSTFMDGLILNFL